MNIISNSGEGVDGCDKSAAGSKGVNRISSRSVLGAKYMRSETVLHFPAFSLYFYEFVVAAAVAMKEMASNRSNFILILSITIQADCCE